MGNPPGGNITFLFTDIEGSTKLAQNYPDILPSLLETHHNILKEAIESNNGFVFEIIGDAFCASFENTIDAVNASHKAQIKLNSENWNQAPLKVRMGIHRGNAEWNGKRYMGYITLARTHRVMSAAYGGQVLISEDAYNQLTSQDENTISYRDLGQRRLKDLIQPVRIFQLVSKDLPPDFPPLVTLDARPNNLPVQLTSFIGRKDEIKKVKELLSNTHLLTLTGPGGAGKTRLALQVGADIIDEFANGVWFVELAPITDPMLLPQEVLKELGVKEETKKALEETLIAWLRDKEILIILDNCEHLIETCALLTEKLLKACPKLKIIATSREPMKCTGEQTHNILSLEIPNLKEEVSAEQLTQFESVRLFIERALAVKPGFRVNNENAPALAGICSQLDGIPLAIELAAARIKVLTVEKIYERLNDRFNLLTGGKRTALPRQQTLKALIDWSYGLLSEQEKLLWSRLTVFNDGWTLESAEKICPDNKIAVNEVIDLLSLLVEKSIIIFNEENERYNILETLRQYGEEKLEEKNALLSKHLHYYVEFAESAEPKLAGPEALVWLDKLETEHGNLQSAVERVLKGGISEDGARLAGALGLFWDIRGYHSTGRLLLESMLENSKGISKAAVAKLLNRAGTLCRNQGDYQQAFNYYEESLALYQEVNDKNGISKCIHNMGVVAFEQGEYEHAREILEKHLAVNRKTGDKENIAYALNELGNMAYDQGDYERAQKLHTESLALRKQTGNKRGVSNSLNNLGNVMTNRGDYENAMKLYKESLDIKRELGDKRGITTALHNFGLLHHYKGDYDLAKTYLEQSITLARDVGDKQGIAETLYELGSIEYKLANYEHAKKFYDESLEIRREIGNKLGMLYCIMGLADVAGLKDDHYRAARLLGFVDSAFNSMKTVFERGDLLKYENAVERLRNVLGEEKYYNYSEEGKKLTLEQAAEIALKDS